MDAIEYSESSTITLEWTLRGLKSLFDSTKGDIKSKVTKSIKFGGGKWQILFYSNSGHEGGGFVSLYLSCEPTEEEKETAVNGKWLREGLYKFSFELRNINRNVLSNPKEACDHAFSYKTANWGWAQFARRDTVFYNSSPVRHVDAFVIICHITSSPIAPPSPKNLIARKAVPRSLMDSVGAMLDDPVYSDVEFVIPGRKGIVKEARTIYAAKRLLKRVDYFDTMFSAGFAEGASNRTSRDAISLAVMTGDGEDPDATPADPYSFDDSDESEDELDSDYIPGPAYHGLSHSASRSTFAPSTSSVTAVNSAMSGPGISRWVPNSDTDAIEPTRTGLPEAEENSGADDEEMHEYHNDHSPTEDAGETIGGSDNGTVRPSAVRVDSVRDDSTYGGNGARYSLHAGPTVEPERAPSRMRGVETFRDDAHLGPKKTRVVVRDVAYATYHAFLYYLYTDSIVFAPLSSHFLPTTITRSTLSMSAPPHTSNIPLPSPAASSNSHLPFSLGALPPGSQNYSSQPMDGEGGHRSRNEWVRDWVRTNPGKPAPCSAKACYRLADKIGLVELKERAFDHIIKSLTVSNVPYEVFSSFSVAFEDVRKVQVEYFLAHWDEIKMGDAMRNVFQQIRLGRHPGFEEVWPAIIVNLEFVPKVVEAAGDGKEGAMA